MTKGFGPWATAFEGTRSAGLSAFWKQRLRMLPKMVGDSAAHARLNALYVVLASAFVFGLPMIREVSTNVVAQEPDPSVLQDPPLPTDPSPVSTESNEVRNATVHVADASQYEIQIQVVGPNIGKHVGEIPPRCCVAERQWAEVSVGGEVPFAPEKTGMVEFIEYVQRVRARITPSEQSDRVRLRVQFVLQRPMPAPEGELLIRGSTIESLRTVKLGEQSSLRLDDMTSGGSPVEVRITVRRVSPAPDDASEPIRPSPEGASKTDASVIWQQFGLALEPVPREKLPERANQFHGAMEVLRVRSNSPAKRAGIRSGDLLIGIEQWETTSLDNVMFVRNRAAIRDPKPLRFLIFRDGGMIAELVRLSDQ